MPVVRPDEYLHISLLPAYSLHAVYGIKTDPNSLNAQTQYRLNGGKECRYVERLEKDLCGNISVLPWIQGSFRQEHRVLRMSARNVCSTRNGPYG
jgi:hypothetical protein